MKKLYFYALSFLAVNTLIGANLADSSQIKKQKEGNPPPLITPNLAQSYFPENQFDHSRRNEYFFVTDKIDSAMSPFKLTSGVYNGSFYGSALTQMRASNVYGALNFGYTKANDYKDGAGEKVGFGYKRKNGALMLGLVPNELNELKFTYLRDEILDDKQPQHGMDSRKTTRDIFKFDARLGEENLDNTLSYGARYRKIRRENDNYSLRQVPSAAMKMGMLPLVKMKRDIWDYYLKYDLEFSRHHNQIGFSYENDDHKGYRYMHNLNAPDMQNAFRVPDVRVDRYKIFDNFRVMIDEQNAILLALAYEINRAKANANDTALNHGNFPSPRKIYQRYYGVNFDGKVDQEALSAELEYDFMPTSTQKYSINLAHIERIGDNTERFSALFNPHTFKNPTTPQEKKIFKNMWGKQMNIGNPFLKNEEHNFIKLGANLKSENYKGYMNSLFGDAYEFGGELLLDEVKNLIIYDRSQRDGAFVVRNVDARIFSAKSYAKYNFNPNFGAKIDAIYTYGQNKTDARALYQVRPFEINLNLDYKDYFSLGTYNFGSNLRAVSRQSRGDFDVKTGLGIDNKESAKGFATMDLYAGLNFKDKFGMRLGVNNIFDKKYSEFISGNHVEALAPSVVNAPGRNVYLSFHAAF